MHSIILFGAALTAAAGASGKFLPDTPPATRLDQLLGRKATTTSEPPTSTLSEDPWQCVTENITQYFNVPTPTGNVLEGINSYGDEVAKPCRATATGLDGLSCTVSDPKSWCGFTTAAPVDVLSSYSTYVSEVVSFWTANSATISVLSTSCPVAWAMPAPAEHEWLKIAMAHAECYLQGHQATKTGTGTGVPTSTTGNANTPTTTMTTTDSNSGGTDRGQVLGALAAISVGLAVLANAA